MQIMKYVPQVQSKKTIIKVGIIVSLALSLFLNYKLVRANYVVRCAAGGMLMSQSKCNDLAQDQTDAQELRRIQFVQNNQDLFK